MLDSLLSPVFVEEGLRAKRLLLDSGVSVDPNLQVNPDGSVSGSLSGSITGPDGQSVSGSLSSSDGSVSGSASASLTGPGGSTLNGDLNGKIVLHAYSILKHVKI